MKIFRLKKQFKKLWPGVAPYKVLDVLAHELERDPEPTQALVHEVLAMSGPNAATRLMQPIVDALPYRKEWDRPDIMTALDALVRAGGDLTPVLDVVVECATHWRTESSAGRVMHRFVLVGGSLAPVHERLVAIDSKDAELRTAQRLSKIQAAGLDEALRSLARSLANQPVGNLRGGIGLVEAQLVSADPVEAERATRCLVSLEAAGKSLHESFLAILPVLTHQLGSGDASVRAEAGRAIAQARYACKASSEREALIASIEPTVQALAVTLSDPSAPSAAAAAEALNLLVTAGASLASVREQVDAALAHASVDVRSPCSTALSAWLASTGAEAPLPPDCSHRPVYATSAEPVSERTSTCRVCEGTQAVAVYAYEGPEQFYRTYIDEVYCPDCGIWAVTHFQAPG